MERGVFFFPSGANDSSSLEPELREFRAPESLRGQCGAEEERWRSLYLLFLEFAVWSSSNSPRLHVQKVAAPPRPHGAAPGVPPLLSTALPRSSPTWLHASELCWGILLAFIHRAESADSAQSPWHPALCRANKKLTPSRPSLAAMHEMGWGARGEWTVHCLFISFTLRKLIGGGGGGLVVVVVGGPHLHIGHPPPLPPPLSPVLARWSSPWN